MEKVIRIGAVGCGQIAQIMHLPYLQDSAHFQIQALSDMSPALLEKVGRKYGVPEERRYTDYDRMIQSEDVDAVLICNKDHYGPAMKAARCGKHIFVEKPLAFSTREAGEIAQAARENGVKVLVGYMKCYDPGFTYAAEKIRKMDNIYLARFHDFSGSFDYVDKIYDLYGRGDVPAELFKEGKDRERRGMMEELGEGREALLPAYFNFIYGIVHDTVLLRRLFGNEGKVLYADVFKEDNMSVLMQYGDVRVSLEIGFSGSMPIWDEDIHVYSPECNVSVKFPFPYLKNAPTVVGVTENEPGTGANQIKSTINSFDEAYRLEWQHFYDCIVNDKEPMTNAEDALLDIRLAGDIMRAVRL